MFKKDLPIKRVVIAGCRDYTDYDQAKEYIDHCLSNIRLENEIIVVSGGAKGADALGEQYAKANGFDYVIVLHGDDQGDIHNLLPVLKKGIYKKYDCCLGARFMNGSKLEGYSKFRSFGNVVYNISDFCIIIGVDAEVE